MRKIQCFMYITILLCTQGAFARDFYVDQSVSSSGDGLSWANAKKVIEEAMVLATSGDAVHVAEGRYVETVTVNNSVTLMGGYPAGGGTRDYWTFLSVIDAGPPLPTQPAVTMGLESTIDGFTIMNGTGKPTMIFSTYGGGIYCDSGPVVIRNNIITMNVVNSIEGAYGGGIYLYNVEGNIYNNIFVSNQVIGFGGGSAIYVWNSDASIFNNYFYQNSCGATLPSSNGAVTFRESSGKVYNNTFVENTSANEGGIYLINSSPDIYNNVLYANSGYGIWEGDTFSDPLCSYNDIFDNRLGVYIDENIHAYTDITDLNTSVPEAENNISSDPMMVSAGNYHLRAVSPCIDTGTSSGAPGDDLDGDPRPSGHGIEIGCDETQTVEVPCSSGKLIIILVVTLSMRFNRFLSFREQGNIWWSN